MSITETAVQVCQTIPRNRIKDFSVPLHLLYEDLIKSKEIVPLTELSRAEKLKYWNETSGEKFTRIVCCQALYVYDLITEPCKY